MIFDDLREIILDYVSVIPMINYSINTMCYKIMHFIDFFILRIKSRAESKETGSNEFEYFFLRL